MMNPTLVGVVERMDSAMPANRSMQRRELPARLAGGFFLPASVYVTPRRPRKPPPSSAAPPNRSRLPRGILLFLASLVLDQFPVSALAGSQTESLAHIWPAQCLKANCRASTSAESPRQSLSHRERGQSKIAPRRVYPASLQRQVRPCRRNKLRSAHA